MIGIRNKLLVVMLASLFSTLTYGQAAPIRGEVSAGNYENLKSDGSGHLLVGTAGTGSARGPEGTAVGAKVALTAASAQSAAVTGSYVDVTCDTDCYVLIAANPTAVVDTSYKVNAYTTYRFPITSGNKIAALVASGTGNLWWHVVQ